MSAGDGAATVSSSHAANGTSSWNALTVGDQSLYGKESAGGSTQHVGLLAPAGSTIDQANESWCRDMGGGVLVCVLLLRSHAGSSGPTSSYRFASANGFIAQVTVVRDGQGAGVVLAPSDSFHVNDCAWAKAALLEYGYSVDGGDPEFGTVDGSSEGCP